jgi:molybdopterin biosynthesis enzyme
LNAADGRVLAADVDAAVSLQPFDNSAMDGYAPQATDMAWAAGVITHHAAGRDPRRYYLNETLI